MSFNWQQKGWPKASCNRLDLRDELKACKGRRPKRTAAELGKVAAARAGIRSLEQIGFHRREVDYMTIDDGTTVVRELYEFADGLPVPAVTFIPVGGRPKGAELVLDDTGRARHAERVRAALKEGKAIMFADLACTGETLTPRPKIYRKLSDDMVSAMLLTLGRSLVGVRAEEMLVLARELAVRTGHAPKVVVHGSTCVAAAHAVAARRDLFQGVDLRQLPLSWTKAVETSAVINFVNVVCGALKDYDWTDLVPQHD